jgi:hypothetical protein
MIYRPFPSAPFQNSISDTTCEFNILRFGAIFCESDSEGREYSKNCGIEEENSNVWCIRRREGKGKREKEGEKKKRGPNMRRN